MADMNLKHQRDFWIRSAGEGDITTAERAAAALRREQARALVEELRGELGGADACAVLASAFAKAIAAEFPDPLEALDRFDGSVRALRMHFVASGAAGKAGGQKMEAQWPKS